MAPRNTTSCSARAGAGCDRSPYPAISRPRSEGGTRVNVQSFSASASEACSVREVADEGITVLCPEFKAVASFRLSNYESAAAITVGFIQVVGQRHVTATYTLAGEAREFDVLETSQPAPDPLSPFPFFGTESVAHFRPDGAGRTATLLPPRSSHGSESHGCHGGSSCDGGGGGGNVARVSLTERPELQLPWYANGDGSCWRDSVGSGDNGRCGDGGSRWCISSISYASEQTTWLAAYDSSLKSLIPLSAVSQQTRFTVAVLPDSRVGHQRASCCLEPVRLERLAAPPKIPLVAIRAALSGGARENVVNWHKTLAPRFALQRRQHWKTFADATVPPPPTGGSKSSARQRVRGKFGGVAMAAATKARDCHSKAPGVAVALAHKLCRFLQL